MATLADQTNAVGRQSVVYVNTIARTDTSAKALFTLKKNSIPLRLWVAGTAASNAGTAALVSVGSSGGVGTEFLAAFDVKTAATGASQSHPSSAGLLGAQILADIIVTGTYLEYGSASSAGGPWAVCMEVLP